MKGITLRHRKTGQEFSYSLFEQKKCYKNTTLFAEFEAKSKLEVEFDYDTDEEQLRCSKTMLLEDLTQAVDFYIRDDPIKLVENVLV